jgi:D-3-phosphoglycerate dehydrogenase
MVMKVLVADKFSKTGLDELRAHGAEVSYDPDLTENALVDAVAKERPEVLVVRSTRVTEPVLTAGPLALVVRAGAGVDTIDIEAASRRGIRVANCPGKNSVAVAELAFGLILALDRRIPEGVADLRRGVWNKKEYSKANGLFGRTLGIVGLGHIGQEMVVRAHAFGMPVVAWEPLPEYRIGRPGVDIVSSPLELAAVADVVSVHLALTEQTRGLIGTEFFSRMRPGSLFINTSRAEVVDQNALALAVKDRGIRAGLDVCAGEPKAGTGEVTDDIFQLERVIGTHHIGASTEQAQEAIGDEAVRIIREYMDTGRAPNTVNLAKKTPATHLLAVTYYDRVGVLAGIFDQLREADINVEEMECVVFQDATAATARIHLSKSPPESMLQELQSDSKDIISFSVVKLQ